MLTAIATPREERCLMATIAERQINWFSAPGPNATISSKALAQALKPLVAAHDRSAKEAIAHRVHVATSGHTVFLASRAREAEIRVSLPGEVSGTLDTLIPWDTLTQLSQIPGPIILDDRSADTIQGAQTWNPFPLHLWHPEGEADMDWAREQPVVEVDAATLSASLKVLCVATARPNDMRQVLRGILISPKDRWCVATDGSHLIRTPWPGPITGPDYVVSLNGVKAILAILGDHPRGQATWQDSRRWVIVRYGTIEVAARYIEGRYPDVHRLFPENYSAEATVDGRELAQAIKAIRRAIRDDRGAIVHVGWRADGLALSVANTETTCDLTVPGVGRGMLPNDVSICATFSPYNLAIVEKTLRAGPVRWQRSTEEWPALLTQDDTQYLIQPVRPF